ncbi:uncharacterized protein LOC119078254 [Bradysia coprophila]|uniref:uncharacterized protein LOC119078254 n=1 Tax=Bradysia coprophila TaxID=38358 RepID=UPI00187DB81F|nr:uncharacterized protein LOC119078254 [Bradysia coprophila]
MTMYLQIEKDFKEIFVNILSRCEQILFADGKDPFEFLDPILSDTQCHIHALFIISKLTQLGNNSQTCDFKNLKTLPSTERTLLSYVVLLSILKYEEIDEVGFVRVNRLIDYFGILTGRTNAEKLFIAGLKETFNSHSTQNLKDLTSGKLKQVLEECDASLRIKKFRLQLQPCYASLYTVLKYMGDNNLPIIIPLVRFKTGQLDDKLSIESKTLLYFEFQKSKNSFVYKNEKNLTEEDRTRPTIVITCYSVITNNYPEYFEEFMDGSQLPSDKFLTEDVDVRELLLVTAAGHAQLAGNNNENRTDDYVKELYKKNSNLSMVPSCTAFAGNFDLIEDNIYGCYERHYNMAQKYGIVDARYSYRLKCADEQGMIESFAFVIRRNENTLFNVDHVAVSTFNREFKRMNTYVVGAAVPLKEPENFCKAKAQEYVTSKLSEIA